MSWTEERVTLLTQLWGDGKTAAEIAKELGGVTRNAVIGKAHRLKLSNRLSPIKKNAVKPAAKTQKPEIKKAAAKKTAPVTKKPSNDVAEKPEPPKRRRRAIVEPEFTGEGVSMAELREKTCRWPIGDPKEADFKFCGCDLLAGLPYCSAHAQVAYQAATRNRILKAEDFEKDNKPKPDNEIMVKEA